MPLKSFIIEDIYNLCPIFAYIYFAGMQKKKDSGLDGCRKERYRSGGMQKGGKLKRRNEGKEGKNEGGIWERIDSGMDVFGK